MSGINAEPVFDFQGSFRFSTSTDSKVFIKLVKAKKPDDLSRLGKSESNQRKK
jgi:hypothetical protein